MNKLKFLFSKTLLCYLAKEAWTRYYWKFVLPKITEIAPEGVRLDVSSLSLKARNRMLHVGYETQEAAMCQRFLSRGDGVLELGSAIGFIGLLCQKKIGIRNYTLVEANPRTLELLKRNYDLNGLTPCAWNAALADKDGSVELEVGSDFWENSTVRGINANQGRKIMDVPAARFRTLLARVSHPVSVLIIDVEGAEQFIDFKTLPDTINKIIIELHPKILGPQKTYEIVSELIVSGFRVADEQDATFVFIRAVGSLSRRGSRPSREFVQAASLPSAGEPLCAAIPNGVAQEVNFAR